MVTYQENTIGGPPEHTLSLEWRTWRPVFSMTYFKLTTAHRFLLITFGCRRNMAPLPHPTFFFFFLALALLLFVQPLLSCRIDLWRKAFNKP